MTAHLDPHPVLELYPPGATDLEIADHIGVSRSTVTVWRRGERGISTRHAAKAAARHRVDPAALWPDWPNPHPKPAPGRVDRRGRPPGRAPWPDWVDLHQLARLIARPPDPGWRDDAACRGAAPDVFFPRKSEASVRVVAAARAICARCPVRPQCLAATSPAGPSRHASCPRRPRPGRSGRAAPATSPTPTTTTLRRPADGQRSRPGSRHDLG